MDAGFSGIAETFGEPCGIYGVLVKCIIGREAGVEETGSGAYVEILEGRNKRVIISPRADEIGDPELSILVVLGLYNMVVENIQGFFESKPKGPLPFIGE